MLASLHHRADIIQYAAEKWHVKARQTDNYIAEALSEMRKAVENDAANEVALARENYALFIREQIAKHDWNGAGLNESRLCHLLGINAADKHELTGPNGAPLNNSDEAKAMLFRAMIEAQAKRLGATDSRPRPAERSSA
jgi:hypothetical protein